MQRNARAGFEQRIIESGVIVRIVAGFLTDRERAAGLEDRAGKDRDGGRVKVKHAARFHDGIGHGRDPEAVGGDPECAAGGDDGIVREHTSIVVAGHDERTARINDRVVRRRATVVGAEIEYAAGGDARFRDEGSTVRPAACHEDAAARHRGVDCRSAAAVVKLHVAVGIDQRVERRAAAADIQAAARHRGVFRNASAEYVHARAVA